MPDGSLRIKTRLDNSNIDKGVVELENKMKKVQSDIAKNNIEQKGLELEIQNYEQLTQKADEYKNKIKKLEQAKLDTKKIPKQELLMNNEEYVEIQNKIQKIKNDYLKAIEDIENKYKSKKTINAKTQLATDKYMPQLHELTKQRDSISSNVLSQDSKEINTQISEIKRKYAEIAIEIDKQSPKIERVHEKLNKVKQKQTENNSKMQEYRRRVEEARKKLEEAKNEQAGLSLNTDGMGKSLNKGITKILRYGMALLSIRSIYGVLSNAMNMWLNGNSKGAKQLKSDIDYMKISIGRALSPVLKYIVNLLYQAIGLAGALIKAFTGIDIFAGSVADYMSSTTSSANKTNKELKKQLASFDKINKLGDNSSETTGSGSSGGGVVAPSQDLSQIMNKYTEFAEKVKKIFDEVKDIIPIIGAGILAWKLSDLFFSQLDGLKSLQAKVGLLLIIDGIIGFINEVKGFSEDGKITGERVLRMLGRALEVGVGAGILTGSVSLGLTFGLILAGIGMAEAGKQTLMGLVASRLGLEESIKQGIYIMSFSLEIGAKISGEENVISLLMKNFKNILLTVANYIEKIPFIGKSIANGIRSAIHDSENDTANTIKYSSKEAMTQANPWIKDFSKESGEKTRKAWQSGYNSLTNETRDVIKNSQNQAFENASTSIRKQAYRKGQEEGKSANEGIGSESLETGTTKLLKTGVTTLNNTDLSQEGKKISGTIRSGYSDNSLNDETQSIINSGKEVLNRTDFSEDGNRISSTFKRGYSINSIGNSTQIMVDGAKNILNSSSLYSQGKILSATAVSGFTSSDFRSMGYNATGQLKEGISNGNWQVQNQARSVATEASNTARNSMDGYSAGRNLTAGIAQGIKSGGNVITSAVNKIANLTIGSFNIAMGIHSPSKVMANQAKYIPLGIAEGIDSTQDKAIGSMKDLVYGMQESVDELDYSNMSKIPKLPRNAVTFVPKQSISTKEVQRSIVGQDSDLLNKLLSIVQAPQNNKTPVTIQLTLDGEELIKKTIELNDNYNLVTNGGGF